jgi:hypothetical protein
MAQGLSSTILTFPVSSVSFIPDVTRKTIEHFQVVVPLDRPKQQ